MSDFLRVNLDEAAQRVFGPLMVDTATKRVDPNRLVFMRVMGGNLLPGTGPLKIGIRELTKLCVRILGSKEVRQYFPNQWLPVQPLKSNRNEQGPAYLEMNERVRPHINRFGEAEPESNRCLFKDRRSVTVKGITLRSLGIQNVKLRKLPGKESRFEDIEVFEISEQAFDLETGVKLAILFLRDLRMQEWDQRYYMPWLRWLGSDTADFSVTAGLVRVEQPPHLVLPENARSVKALLEALVGLLAVVPAEQRSKFPLLGALGLMLPAATSALDRVDVPEPLLNLIQQALDCRARMQAELAGTSATPSGLQSPQSAKLEAVLKGLEALKAEVASLA